MKWASSTTMPRKPRSPEPADVAVQHLVVDDHDVGEPVDVVAVAVDHGRRVVRRPDVGLAGPVRLDDVRDDDQQRERVGGLRGEQRLRGLAEAGLVGEQERAVALGGRGDERAWCGISWRPNGARTAAVSSGSAMQADAPLAAYSNDVSSGPISSQPASRRGRTGRAAPEKSGTRNGLARRRETTDCGTTWRSAAGGARSRDRRPASPARVGLDAGGGEHLALELAARSRRSAASSASSTSREVSRVAVFARIVATPSSRLSCSARCASVQGGVGLDPGPLLADQQGDDLELGAHRRGARGRAPPRPRPRARRGRAPG